MNWVELLSGRRFGEDKVVSESETRSRFEQDYDRIIFSHPFRKLQDKTQVFPLPEDDFVHTRLTHSLEVSSVARSLGKIAGKSIIDKYSNLEKLGFTYNDFGAITAAAALAHDLGNPPFGHSGESAISDFFKNHNFGQFFEQHVSESEWQDLTNFEGNAQGFRILNSSMYGGLKLTYATLAAFTKYPKSSRPTTDRSRRSQKKYGFTQTEKHVFEVIAQETGLVNLGDASWVRHPLAFLVEAADDICYNIIDLEDGTRLGLVPFEVTRDLLANIIGERYSSEKLDSINGLNEKLGTLRALAISQLIHEITASFMENEKGILSGDFDTSLADVIPSKDILNDIVKLSVEKIYRSKNVNERESAGFEVLENIMTNFTQAVYYSKFDKDKLSPKHKVQYRMLPEEYQIHLNGVNSVYESMQIVCDFVSGLTDSSALKLHQTISGVRIS